jgi:hypothetical protein
VIALAAALVIVVLGGFMAWLCVMGWIGIIHLARNAGRKP